jgi:group I intron endonuclease
LIIYKVTNRINGKVYIGQTKRSLEARWKAHCAASVCWWKEGRGKLQRAIHEYGRENFTVERIDVAADKEEANAKEVYWIAQYNAVENGYNSSLGGKYSANRKRVLAVEDGLIFDTIKEAAAYCGRSASSIQEALDKPHLTSAGRHWVSVKKV